jgi:hypothetical protein
MCVSNEVLMQVDDIGALIAGNPQGISGLQLSPRPIYLLNIIIIAITD